MLEFEVRFGALTRYGAVTQDGHGEAVQGLVLGLRGVNARELVTALDARIASVQKRLPPGISVAEYSAVAGVAVTRVFIFNNKSSA